MKELKKYLLFGLGLMIFGFGISFGNKSFLGANPMGVLVYGLSMRLAISIGTGNLLVGLFETAFGYLLEKKNVTWATIIGMFCGSYAIDLANAIVPDSTSMTVRVIYMLAGMACYCFGVALQLEAGCGYSNLDCFIFGIARLLGIKEYHRVRWLVDGAFLVSGWLLGGIIGVGSVLLIFGSGLLIEWFRELISRMK